MKARLLAPALILGLTALSVSSAAGTTRVEQARQAPGQSAARHAALNAYRKLPLAFLPNAGQLDRRVRYSAQEGNASVFLTRREVVVALAEGRRGLALRLAFLGASANAAIVGGERNPGRVNYLVGNDPSRWQQNLPSYAEVVYRDLWPGVDLALRGRGGQLKYEFRLAPGVDPAQIRLRYGGQERLALERNGALRIETRLGVLRDARPLSYQLVDGERVAVGSRFAPGRGGAYGFALGAYDRRYPLVIDPGLLYSTYLGGSSEDYVEGIAVDGAGSVYVTGTTSTNFPTTTGAFEMSHNGYDDAFVTKLNAGGSALAYSTYLGGSVNDYGVGIAVDRTGSAYVTGRTNSDDFPTTAGAFDRSFDRVCEDAFVAKLNAAGSALAYSTYLGGDAGCDRGEGIAVDSAGSPYVTGVTRSLSFPTSPGALDMSYNGGDDAFVTKLNAAGSALAYSTFLGGTEYDGGDGIAVDGAGSAYITGRTDSANFPTSPGAFDRSYNRGNGDAFVSKLNEAGSALAYSTYVGGSNDDQGYSVAVGARRAYVTGFTDSSNFPTTARAFDRSHNGYTDAFATKLNAGGSALAYSTFLGGSDNHESASGIAVDGAGSAYLTGETASTRFPTTAGAFDRSIQRNPRRSDAFVTKLNAAGSALAYSTYLGGSGNERGAGIAIGRAGTAYVAGATLSTKFPTTAGAFDGTLNGELDAFVTKLDLVSCRVPRLIGMKFAKAKRTIRAAHCSVGRVRRVRSTRVGRVVAQSPAAGAVRRRGFKVNLIVGRRH